MITERKATHNGRFGAMAAVSPQTILCKFARYYPAASSVEAATAPSRWDVSSNSGDSDEQKGQILYKKMVKYKNKNR